MTANQLVALKLRRLRERDGLTQEQVTERLEPLLGRRWSQASYSAAEISHSSNRVRQFDANEILAFSIVFDVPVGYFFQPVSPDEAISAGGPEVLDAKALYRASSGVGEADPESVELLKQIQGQLRGVTQVVGRLSALSETALAHGMENFPVEELDLGIKTLNVLKRVGVETIGDLVMKTEQELAAIPNFSKKSIEEVRDTLSEHGLRLRGSVAAHPPEAMTAAVETQRDKLRGQKTHKGAGAPRKRSPA